MISSGVNMNDLKSRIIIEDGFSEELEELSKQTDLANKNVEDLSDSIEELNKNQKDQINITDKITQNFIKLSSPLDNIKERLVDVSVTSAKMFKEFAVEKIGRLRYELSEIATNFSITFKNFTVEKITMLRDSVVEIINRFDELAIEKFHQIVGGLKDIVDELGLADIALGGLASTQKRVLDIIEQHDLLGGEVTKSIITMYNGSLDAVNQLLLLSDSIHEALTGTRAHDIFFTVTKNFLAGKINPILDVLGGLFDYGSFIQEMVNDGSIGVSRAVKMFMQRVKTEISGSGSAIKAWAKGVTKSLAINIGIVFAKNFLLRILGLTKDLKELLERSFDDIAVGDKFVAMFGEAGKEASKAASKLAYEIGADAGMIASKAQEAAFKGIGTKSFERITKLADKVSKLSTGETLTSVIDTMINNVKEGHDADTMSRTLGGGDMMSRRLKRAGYERALNRGDLSKALDIAEKIAEQSGLTEEKYKKASDTLSQNYAKIQNIIKNMKADLDAVMSGKFEKVIHNVRVFMESDTFKRVFGLLRQIAEYFAESFASSLEFITAHINLIPAIGLAAIIAKLYLITKSMKANFQILMASKKIIMFFGSKLGIQGLVEFARSLTKENAKQLALEKAKAAIKPTLKFAAIGAAGAAAVYGIYKGLDLLTNKLREVDERFSNLTLSGLFLGGLQVAQNIFTNIFILVHNLFNFIGLGLRGIPAFILKGFSYIAQGANWLKEKIISGIQYIINSAIDLIVDGLTAISNMFSNVFNKKTAFGKALSSVPILSAFKPLNSSLTEKDREEKVNRLKKRLHSTVNRRAKIYNEEIFASKDPYSDASKFMFDRARELMPRILSFVSVTDGYEKALETNGDSVLEKLGFVTDFLKKFDETGDSIKDNTDSIRRATEQEEELRWMKAFSDRQVMSQYHNMTSNNKTVNINGMSQSGLIEMGRRNIVASPSRAII